MSPIQSSESIDWERADIEVHRELIKPEIQGWTT